MGKMLYTSRAHLWQHTTRAECTYPEPLFSFRHVVFKSRVALVTRVRAPRQRKKRVKLFYCEIFKYVLFYYYFFYLKFHIKITTLFTLSKILVSNFYLFESYQKYLHRDKGNRHFYRYGGHIELDLRSIMGCPGGMSTIRKRL